MPQFFITYGFDHGDDKGRSLHKSYSIVEAPNEDEAREAVNAARGGKWAFCYLSAEQAGVGRWNLECVPLTAHVEPQE